MVGTVDFDPRMYDDGSSLFCALFSRKVKRGGPVVISNSAKLRTTELHQEKHAL